MDVEFRKTGKRRYTITVVRENAARLEMNPAPGYDPYMPHDMLHLIVEKELKLSKGIFGQLANGGTAGSFRHINDQNSTKKQLRRLRKKKKKRGKKLLKDNSDECAQSERATYLSLYYWLSRSKDAKLRSQASNMKDNLPSIMGAMSQGEKARLNDEKLASIKVKMDEASHLWSSLEIGSAMTLSW